MAEKEIIAHRNPSFPVTEFIDNYDLAGGYFPSHWHPEWEITVILQGRAQYNVDGNEYIVPAGNSIYIAPEAVHFCSSTEPGTLGYNLCINPSLLTDLYYMINTERYLLPLQTRQPEAFVIAPSSKSGYQIYEIMRRLYSATDHTAQGSELLLLGSLLEIWHLLLVLLPPSQAASTFAEQNTKEQRMKRMLSFIHENYARPLSVADIANAAAVSSSECFRCFSEYSYGSPAEYINRYRLSQAARKLAKTNLSITDICYDVGFNSTSYFAKEFKKHYQRTPKEYRLVLQG